MRCDERVEAATAEHEARAGKRGRSARQKAVRTDTISPICISLSTRFSRASRARPVACPTLDRPCRFDPTSLDTRARGNAYATLERERESPRVAAAPRGGRGHRYEARARAIRRHRENTPSSRREIRVGRKARRREYASSRAEVCVREQARTKSTRCARSWRSATRCTRRFSSS